MTYDLRASIQLGNRVYSELLSLEQERLEYIDWCKDAKEEFNLNKFRQKYRDVKIEGFSELCRIDSHFLIGWVESLGQSDFSPFPMLEEFNDYKGEYIFTMERM